ncbi:MAG: cyclodeaminase/cyclohydrolase family protein, partial [Bacteroidales bacterium]|nr:cyclodeaminase/cyclohydrolase family protein [Bacteroidales bacterium]
SPAPGGGSVAAYMGAMGAALGTMVANLSAHKPGWDDRWEEFSNWAEQGMAIEQELLHLVNEDTEAFNKIMAAFGMPKATDDDKARRAEAIENATLFAAQIPLQTMKAAMKVLPLCRAMAETGNPNSVSDAGVGALAARSAVIGAALNVKINAASLQDKATAQSLIDEAEALVKQAKVEEEAIIAIVEKTITK